MKRVERRFIFQYISCFFFELNFETSENFTRATTAKRKPKMTSILFLGKRVDEENAEGK